MNDSGSLGRGHPDEEGCEIPGILQSLKQDNFRAVQIVATEMLGAALSFQGDVRIWGSFRVSLPLRYNLSVCIFN